MRAWIYACVLMTAWVARGSTPPMRTSAADAEVVKRLFHQHVPEIAAGTVRIRAIAREPHTASNPGRTKIAVSADDPELDPIRACVGENGARIRKVVEALHGERIDIVPWEEDGPRFVCNALAPAQVQRIVVDDVMFQMLLIVADDQRELAFGPRGLNARLAAELTGWQLVIRSVSEEIAKKTAAQRSFSALKGMTPKLAEALYQYGFENVEQLARAHPDELAEAGGLDHAAALLLQERARKQVTAP